MPSIYGHAFSNSELPSVVQAVRASLATVCGGWHADEHVVVSVRVDADVPDAVLIQSGCGRRGWVQGRVYLLVTCPYGAGVHASTYWFNNRTSAQASSVSVLTASTLMVPDPIGPPELVSQSVRDSVPTSWPPDPSWNAAATTLASGTLMLRWKRTLRSSAAGLQEELRILSLDSGVHLAASVSVGCRVCAVPQPCTHRALQEPYRLRRVVHAGP